MIEVEVKLPIEDPELLVAGLLELGFTHKGFVRETDTYFDNEEERIRKSGEAFRIRTITNILTREQWSTTAFKGQKLDQVSVTRPEYEVSVSDPEMYEKLLNGLGFHGVEPKVVKVRREYARGSITACLDAVQGLGDFLELEIVLDDDDESKDEALMKLAMVLGSLGYQMEQTTRRSYLSMLQDRAEE